MHTSFVDLIPYLVHYAVSGPKDADRTLLVFNGIGANIDTLKPFIENFSRTRVVTFDIPGTGKSPAPFLPYHYSKMADLAAKLLDHLGINSVDVFGVSWGGGLAQQFAYDHKQRVNKLILAATSAGVVHYPGRVSALQHMFTPRRHEDPEYMKSVAGDLYGGQIKEDPDLLKEHLDNMGPVSKRGYLYQLWAISTWTSWSFLPSLDMPTMVMVGKEDPILPSYNGHILESRLPNAHRVEMDCGHLFIVSQPDLTAGIVEDFLHAPCPKNERQLEPQMGA